MKAFPEPNADPGAVHNLASKNLAKLVWAMVRPYKKWLIIIFLAMVVETCMSLATPWPLKIIIDNVIGHRPLPGWLSWMDAVFPRENRIQFAAIAAITVIFLAVIGSVASYIDNYFTESVAQYVSNDLRRRIYHHLQRLSLTFTIHTKPANF